MTTLNQRSFSGGEISPFLYARVDYSKYVTGLRTCKNFMVLRHGGVSNRPGTTFVCEVKDSSKVVRLIKFEYNSSQTYQLEFGDEYIRFIENGEQVRLTATNITAITKANPVVVTSNAHGYSNGDEVYISGVVGMLELNGRSLKVYGVTANTYELRLMDGTTNVNSTSYTTYVSGGTAKKVYELATTYQDTEVFDINFVQSADVVTLVHPSHPPRELTRISDTSWTLGVVSFVPSTTFPTALAVTAGAGVANTYRYKVTSINEETFEESLPGVNATTRVITAITAANPAVVTSAAHGFANGDEVMIRAVVGMTELNDRIFTIANVAANTFELEDVNSTAYTAYSSAGTANRVFCQVASDTPTALLPNVVSWTKVSTAREYNIYKEANGLYGLIGIAVGGTFNDINQTPDTTTTPPNSRNPFIGAGNYPSTVTYIQQRLGFGNTTEDTEKIWLSQTGDFKNFTTSSPLQADDAVTFSMNGYQVNAVRHMLDLSRLVILTQGGEWSAAGTNDGPLTPTSINPKQHSYNGCGDLRPLIVNGAAIYQQARGSIVRDLGFDYQVDGYTGNDLTISSSHLFDNYTLVDWAYQQIPHSIVWAARSDGVLLGMTYVREQQMLAWHRHVFHNGTVESVSVVPEDNEDVLYLVIKRTINSVTKRYIEKFTSRAVIDIIDVKILDSSLSYDGRNTTATTMTLSGGTTWVYTESLTLTSSAVYFSALDVGNRIDIYTPVTLEKIRCTITAYTSTTVVTVTPHMTVPVAARTVAISAWDRAVDELYGLWHLEGQTVSVFADSFVVASPNNESYGTVTVTGGKVTLDQPYAVIHIGLPITSDIETLDVDTADGETLSDKAKNVQGVTMYVESSRGIWAGRRPPTSDTVDPLEGLRELKIRNDETMGEPVSLRSEPVGIIIDGDWNSNGRVFVRQVDPIPLTILSVAPTGRFPFRRGN